MLKNEMIHNRVLFFGNRKANTRKCSRKGGATLKLHFGIELLSAFERVERANLPSWIVYLDCVPKKQIFSLLLHTHAISRR